MEGVSYRRGEVVVPKVLREAVLQGMHGGVGTGHFEVPKTLHQRVYWGQHKLNHILLVTYTWLADVIARVAKSLSF